MISRTSAFAAIFTAALLGGAASASADWLPGGSWQRTCTDARMNGDRLSASCRTRDGRLRTSSLVVGLCRGEISNQDGRLSCEQRRPRLPGGSWQRSCTDARMNGDTLFATCRTRNGQMMRTQINIRGCRGDLANLNGWLTCGG